MRMDCETMLPANPATYMVDHDDLLGEICETGIALDPSTLKRFGLEFVDAGRVRCNGCGREWPVADLFRAVRAAEGAAASVSDLVGELACPNHTVLTGEFVKQRMVTSERTATT